MSKILIIPDIHYCKNSSIIQSRGKKYSKRIENCIASINWAEEYAIKESCTSVIYLGDFFDSDNLDAEVLSSLQDIKFNNLPHYCLAGNHEISLTNNTYSSIKLLQNFNNIEVISRPETLESDLVYLHLLPYNYDIDEDIKKYFDFSDKAKKHILLSHNDIKNINYGKFLSTSGLDIDILNYTCDLTINGHIHNSSWITEKVLNLGILTGKNFSEDAFEYKHCVVILNIDDYGNISTKEVENPYAFNFYKIEVNTVKDLNILDNLKNNSIISVKVSEDNLQKVRELIKNNSNITESRITLSKNIVEHDKLDELKADLTVNHLDKLKEFCLERIENTETLLNELQEICN